jgi:hypothetical protein
MERIDYLYDQLDDLARKWAELHVLRYPADPAKAYQVAKKEVDGENISIGEAIIGSRNLRRNRDCCEYVSVLMRELIQSANPVVALVRTLTQDAFDPGLDKAERMHAKTMLSRIFGLDDPHSSASQMVRRALAPATVESADHIESEDMRAMSTGDLRRLALNTAYQKEAPATHRVHEAEVVTKDREESHPL